MRENTGHANNFGVLRLIFATLVILSHSFPLAQGWNNDEPLAKLTGTIAFGELAVDGFFLLSGYLITKSVLQSRGPIAYLRKRVARIYPGFIVASLISVFAVGPAVGGTFTADPGQYLAILRRLIILSQPELAGAFAGLYYQALNGSLWTIAYEFFCYLLTLALAAIGLMSRKPAYLAITVALFVLSIIASETPPIHSLANLSRLTGFFLVGGMFFLERDRIPYRDSYAALAAPLFLACMFHPWTASIGIATFGGYLLFWAGFRSFGHRVRRIGQRDDISYGVYLYAWPIQNVIVWCYPGISPWLVFAFATPLAFGAGLLSWKLIEQPALLAFGSRRAAHEQKPQG